MVKIVKIKEVDGKQVLKKSEMEGLRGSIGILDTENSEIAKRLDIKDKGFFGAKSR